MSRAVTLPRASAAAWGTCLAGGAGLALAAAYAPVQAAAAGLVVAAAAAAIHVLGLRLGTWCLFVGTIPLREALGVDVVGTTTLYANDLLLLALALSCLREHGFREILRGSATFRLGAISSALTIAGLYTATRLFWGMAFVVHELGQTTAFYVAWHRIRDGRAARWTLLAFVIGLVPAAALGIRESGRPVREFQEAGGFVPAIAWDESGNPHVRVFSTFEHPLHFSHALSTGAGLAAGLIASAPAAGRVLLVAAAATAAYANQFTYSMGGLLGTAAGLLSALLFSKRRWVLALVPVGLALWVLVAPRALLVRVESNLSGRNPTTVARLITYQQTFRVLQDHPILGVGWGSIRTALEEDYRVTRDEVVAFTAENYFLQRALAHGLVGLGIAVALCVLYFRNLRARPPDRARWPRTALLTGGIAFYVQAQFIPTADPASRYVLWILFALAERMRRAARDAAEATAP